MYNSVKACDLFAVVMQSSAEGGSDEGEFVLTRKQGGAREGVSQVPQAGANAKQNAHIEQ